MSEFQKNVWHIDDFSDDVPDKTFDCPPCKKKFRNKFQMHRHLLRNKLLSKHAPFHCDWCGIPFLIQGRKEEHEFAVHICGLAAMQYDPKC